MDSIDPAQTAREVDFLSAHALHGARDRAAALDVCCGVGRHAIAMAQRGCDVTGIDVNASAIARARRDAQGLANCRFVPADMRDLQAVAPPAAFDAAWCLWQSFGFFDADANRRVLTHVAQALRPAGRFVLDIYNRAFFESRLGERVLERNGRHIIERTRMSGDRLPVELAYVDESVPASTHETRAEGDRFEWQVFTLPQITALMADVGLHVIASCTRFNADAPVRDVELRMQIVAERAA